MKNFNEFGNLQQEDESVVFHADDRRVSFEEYAPISNPPTEQEIQDHEKILNTMTPKEMYIFSKVREVAEQKIKLLVEGMGFESYETMTRFFLYEGDENKAGFHSIVANDYGMSSRAIRVSWDNLKKDELKESVSTVIHEKIHNLASSQEIVHENGVVMLTNGLRIDKGFADILYTLPTQDIQKFLENRDANFEGVLGLLIDSCDQYGLELFSHVGAQSDVDDPLLGWREHISTQCDLNKETIDAISRVAIQYNLLNIDEVRGFIRANLLFEGGEYSDDWRNNETVEFSMGKFFLETQGEALDEATVEFLSRYAVGLEYVMSEDTDEVIIQPVNSYVDYYSYKEWTGIWMDCAYVMNSGDTQHFIQTLKEAELYSDPSKIISFFRQRFGIAIEIDKLENMELTDLPDMIQKAYEEENQEELDRQSEIETIRKTLLT